jgi:hypothetical protein
MQQISLTLVTLSFSTVLATQQPVAVHTDSNDELTVVGCVVKGEGGSVLSTDAIGVPAAPVGSATSTVTSASEVAGRVFYWLDDDDEIDEHAGRTVEIIGELEDDIDQGTISVEREDGMVEIEFKAEGERKVTVKVPDTRLVVSTSDGIGDREKDYRVVIRKIDVESVKVLASTCQ